MVSIPLASVRCCSSQDVKQWMDGFAKKEVEEEGHSICGLVRASVAVIGHDRGLREWGGF